jgi:hypothetical protein
MKKKNQHWALYGAIPHSEHTRQSKLWLKQDHTPIRVCQGMLPIGCATDYPLLLNNQNIGGV